MTRILFIAVVAALVAAPAALADGVGLNATINGEGLLSADGKTRTVAVGLYGGHTTMLTKISTSNAAVLWAIPFAGSWGLPTVTGSVPEGLSADGKTLVLADARMGYPKTQSRFLVVGARSFKPRLTIALKGDWAYDAMSPTGDWLYLIQHTTARDISRYVVRKYDTISGQLLPGRVADRTQKSWVMQGFPISRATSADGRWVYTLYDNPGGFPFVHALDTVRGVAHCTGFPWRGKHQAVYNLRLTLHGDSLAVHWGSGRPWYRMDTSTWQLSPDAAPGFPWWTIAVGALTLAGCLMVMRIAPRRSPSIRGFSLRSPA